MGAGGLYRDFLRMFHRIFFGFFWFFYRVFLEIFSAIKAKIYWWRLGLNLMKFSEAYTFDDVLLVPAFSSIIPSKVNTATFFTRDISLGIPLISAAMDTVTEHNMAIALAEAGGIGVLHKNLSITEQSSEVKKVKKFESGMVVDPVKIFPDQTLSV